MNSLDLVDIKYHTIISVFYGRCLHRGALIVDEDVEGQNIICGIRG